MRKILIFLFFPLLLINWQKPILGTGKDRWVDDVLSKMSIEEKIAQLIIAEVRPSKGQKHLDFVDTLVTKYKIGGVIFFKTDPQNLFLLSQKYQSLATIPLLVSIDGEWGLSMRLDNTISYPYQVGLGGIQDESLIYKMGRDIGKQCKRLGIHLNFAPVIDVNNNPENPVINFRSFGEDPDNVSRKGWLYAKGLQDEGIIACAKHFPGHGDTKTDSHKDLPIILHNRSRLDSIELKPFKYLIDSGVMSIMTAHVFMPAIDTTNNLAISLSSKGVNYLLKKELNFKGLAITDALDMKGASKFFSPGTLELKALMAGNDILLCPSEIPTAIDTIKNAIADGRFSVEDLNTKVKKVLEAKVFAGLDKKPNLYYPGIIEDLNNTDALSLFNKLVESEICVANNENGIIPVFSKPFKKIAVLALGNNAPTYFENYIKELGNCDLFSVGKNFGVEYCTNIVSQLEPYDLVIIGLHQVSKYPKDNYGITTDACSLVSQLKEKTNVALVCFGNPYSMRNFPGIKTCVFAFNDEEPYYKAAAEIIWGMKKADAKLSITISNEYKLNNGVTLFKSDKLIAGSTSVLKLKKLQKIDSIVNKAIKIKAMPGCQVLVAHRGKVVFSKSFGYQTYDKTVKIDNNQLYDIASITKIASTTLAIMKLKENNQINLDDSLVKYLPELKGSNKQFITIREILVHESGLKDFIPFYNSFKNNPQLRDSVLSYNKSDNFCYEIGKNLFVNKNYYKTILKEIANSPLGKKGKYVYSDLGMIMLRFVIERVTNLKFEEYLDNTFYKPMGLKMLTFNPLNKFSKSQIVPTEKDPDFRKGVLHGYVHDPSAALLGGISGHAGLFSNSYQLAEIGQMLLNFGFYNGKRYLKQSTIIEFSSRQNKESRRGLGFDRAENTPGKLSPVSSMASDNCFGHTGFTGTCLWIDPDKELVYVFLSNRIHPSSENKLLITKNVRTDIMDVIYNALK
ncbi:MAG: serine hydrolase [Bacteroidetes bacterium]|nr:serine hydrolase [Bacteroidota bacterium]